MLFEEERKQSIADYVYQFKRASVTELAQRFQVSESTIRRDLKGLEEARQLRRTHGGAVAFQDDNAEPPYLEKADMFQAQKEAIAAAGAALIEEGDTILLDAGTTTCHLANRIKSMNRLTVVTNSLAAAKELAGHAGIDLIVTGGMLRQETLAMVGPIAEQAIGAIHVDKAFIATNSLDRAAGLTTPTLIEASVKGAMIRSASRVILLADHSKYGRVSFARVGVLSDIDQWITDEGISAAAINDMETAGIEVTIAKAESVTA